MSLSRRTLLAASSLLLLGGCGFRLRGSYTLPFETLYVDLPENDPFGVLVARNLRAATEGVRLVSDAEHAQAVLRVTHNRRTREEIAYNAQGRAREYELTVTMAFRLSNPAGITYLPDIVLTASRTVTYDESQYLSHEFQDEQLYKEMQHDILSQLLRRLSAAKPLHDEIEE